MFAALFSKLGVPIKTAGDMPKHTPQKQVDQTDGHLCVSHILKKKCYLD